MVLRLYNTTQHTHTTQIELPQVGFKPLFKCSEMTSEYTYTHIHVYTVPSLCYRNKIHNLKLSANYLVGMLFTEMNTCTSSPQILHNDN